MLLQHAWLAPLLKPDIIAEEDEETAEAEAAGAGTGDAGTAGANGDDDFHDREVGEWVIQALERRRSGRMGKSLKPALHAVALDAVSPKEQRADVKPVAVDA